ncbi:MAG: hypothetical protein INR62_00730 [Rhodospirillales bacterium]|nr:hypothetical protein [Acetobacter sp.]
MSRIRTIVAATLAIGAGGVVAGGTGSAAAAEVFHVDNGRTTVVYLTHAETVTAAHVGAGNAINMLMGNDRWAVTLEQDSRYAEPRYYRPDKNRVSNNVTSQQIVAEAAAHPNGRVALGISPRESAHPLWVQQVW